MSLCCIPCSEIHYHACLIADSIIFQEVIKHLMEDVNKMLQLINDGGMFCWTAESDKIRKVQRELTLCPHANWCFITVGVAVGVVGSSSTNIVA